MDIIEQALGAQDFQMDALNLNTEPRQSFLYWHQASHSRSIT